MVSYEKPFIIITRKPEKLTPKPFYKIIDDYTYNCMIINYKKILKKN